MTDFLSSIHALADLPGHIGAAVVVTLGAALIVVPSIAARLRGGR